MPQRTEELDTLTDADRSRLEAFLCEFEQSWVPGTIETICVQLRDESTEYRRAAVKELVKIDMERNWKSGHPRCVEDYLNDSIELGTAETVPVDLVLSELEIRKRFRQELKRDECRQRFPQQYPFLAQWWDEQQANPSEAADDGSGAEGQSHPVRQFTHFPVRFGKYSIERELGTGGMGTVYLARDTSLFRDVAIKIPHAADASEWIHHEAQILAQLRHPNICPVYEVNNVDGVHFIAMAYIEGPTLAQRLKNFGPLQPRQAARATAVLASALGEAHRRGIVHRDLKPSNVIMDRDGSPLVTDFGLAVVSQELDTDHPVSQGGLLGTIPYMSPEQIERRHVDVGVTSDIYSLGVMLYEMLTGVTPFRGTAREIHDQIVNSLPEPPSARCPQIDPALEATCMKMLAKRRECRFASMEDVIRALENDGTDVPTAPQTNRRIRRILSFVSTVFLLTLLATITYVYLGSGTLRVELADVTLQVELDGRQLAIEDSWQGRVTPGRHSLHVRVPGQELRLDTPIVVQVANQIGQHRLRLQLNGATLSSNEFDVLRGQTTVLKISHDVSPQVVNDGQVLVEHRGNASPEQGGWDRVGGLDNGVKDGNLDSDGTNLLPAWYVDDNAGRDDGLLHFIQDVSADVAADAARRGWILRAQVRVVDVPDKVDWSVCVDFVDGVRRWQMLFGAESNGDPVVRLPLVDANGPGCTVHDGAYAYHLYELRFDPQTDQASLWVDGQLRVDGYAGAPAPNSECVVRWGSEDSHGIGQGNYHLVQLVIAAHDD